MSGADADLRAALSRLPQVDAVLRLPAAAEVSERHGRRELADVVRAVVEEARAVILAASGPHRGAADVLGSGAPALPRAEAAHVPVPGPDEVLAAAVDRLAVDQRRRVQRVINATGVVLHTNLGRAPLSAEARRAVADAAGYASVEFDLDTGSRGSRTAYLGVLAARLSQTPAATVVNNGAAALLLALTAVAAGREVVVSRGELIEIGGSFRLPEVMAASGARMVEVGTTNRTRPEDYAAAIGPDTAALLTAHRSNFLLTGFTAQVSTAELAALAHAHELPLIHDLGSGLVEAVDGGPLAVLAGEPPVRRVVRDGADLVVYSGDKLLGGPQAGVIAGRADLVGACTRHPLARAVRVDKLQRAAMEATLLAHLRADDPAQGPDEVPTIGMLRAGPGELKLRAEQLADRLLAHTPLPEPWDVRVVELAGVVGGGALPGVELPSAGLSVVGGSAAALAARLRAGRPPVIVRIDAEQVLIDVRTVAPDEDVELLAGLQAALAALAAPAAPAVPGAPGRP